MLLRCKNEITIFFNISIINASFQAIMTIEIVLLPLKEIIHTNFKSEISFCGTLYNWQSFGRFINKLKFVKLITV